jgi:hypothetical protein
MIVLIPLVITSLAVAVALKFWPRHSHRTSLGFMSEQWIAECQASQPTSSV